MSNKTVKANNSERDFRFEQYYLDLRPKLPTAYRSAKIRRLLQDAWNVAWAAKSRNKFSKPVEFNPLQITHPADYRGADI